MERILKCVISVDGTVLVTKQNGFENENNAIKIVGSAVGFETYEKYIDFNNNGTILKSPNLSVGTKDFEYYIPQNLSTGILKYQFIFIDGETIIKSQVVSIEFKESINATELLEPESTDIFHDFEVRISEVEELVNTFIQENETSITIGTVESGASPSVVNVGTAKDQVWNFVLEKGEQGVSISSINLISTVGLIKTYRITFTDNTIFDYTVSDGATGATGATGANLTFGASFTSSLPISPVINVVYPFAGTNATLIGGITWFNGDYAQWSGSAWVRIPFQSMANYYTKNETDILFYKTPDREVINSRTDTGFFSDIDSQTSTFSGFGSPIVTPVGKINRITIKILQWNASSPITQVRMRLRNATYDGTILANVLKDVTLTTGIAADIQFDFNELTFTGSESLWLEYMTNGKVGRSKILAPHIPASPQSRYAISADVDANTAFNSSSHTVLYAQLDYVESKKQLIYNYQTDIDYLNNTNLFNKQISFNFDKLVSFNAKIAKLKNSVASTQLVAMIFGDSWVNGGFRLHTPFANYLKNLYGDAGGGYVSIITDNTVPVGVLKTRTGTWTESDAQSGSYGIDLSHASTTDTAATFVVQPDTGFTVAFYVVYFLKSSTGGIFKYKIGSGSFTDVDTADATTQIGTVTVTGTEALTIGITSGTVTILGVELKKTINGVRVHKIGNGGITGLNAINVNKTYWKQSMTVIAPDIVFILLGTNDMNANTDLIDFKFRIKEICTRIREVNANTDIVLIAPANNGLIGKTYTMEQYARMMFDLAIENNFGFINLTRILGSTYDIGNTLGLYGDNVHPNANGGQVINKYLLKALNE